MSIEGPDGLHVTFGKPSELVTLAQEISATQPDLLALDYRLNDPRKERPFGYKAGPLAQQLRDQALETVSQDFPIILVSHQDDIKAFFDNVTAHNLFDRCFSKEELGNGGSHRLQILSLVKGYKHLIKNWSQPERWSIFFGLSAPEKVRVGYQAIRELDKLKAPHQVAGDILRYVIDRQGLLLDKDNLLAELGVAKEKRDVDALLDILKQDKLVYTGIFSEGWTRWWSHGLEDWEKNLCDEQVSIPRWTIPPMELILTCEMIIANFYPDKWDKMSGQKKWLELIRVAQQLCYPSYIERFKNCLYGGQPHSVLRALWAKEWGT
jgi:hypothetical protein